MATRGQKRAVEPPKDWEDEFHRLKVRYDELKIEFNEKEQHNKLLQAKIRKLESDLSQIDLQMGGPRTTAATSAREDKEMIDSLNAQVTKLKNGNNALQKEVKDLTDALDKKKRELHLVKKTAYLHKPNKHSRVNDENSMQLEVLPAKTNTLNGSRSLPQPRVATAPFQPQLVPEPPLTQQQTSTFSSGVHMAHQQDEALLQIAQKQKSRIAVLEEEVHGLRDENSRLRLASTTSATANSTMKSSSQLKTHETESQLRDVTWRYQQLQAQYDHLVAKSSTHSESSKKIEGELEDNRIQMRELRRLLEELRYEKEASDSKASRVKGLEDLVAELRQANRSLEEKITRLCEAPFISDAFGQHESQLKYEELLQQRDALLVKVDHLKEAAHTHHSALTTMKQQAATLRDEKESAEREVQELKSNLRELETGKNDLQDKLRLYTGDDDIDVESLEKALTMVKRRSIALEKLPFLEYPDDATGDLAMITIPSLKRKVQEYQLLNLRLTEENEKLENMLKLQSSINRDLQKELESLVMSRDKDRSDLGKQAYDWEKLAVNRLDKIHVLEAQVRQFVYGLSKQSKRKSGKIGKDDSVSYAVATAALADTTAGGNDDDDDGGVSHSHSDLIAELLRDREDGKNTASGDLPSDENLLEIWVRNADIKDGILTPGSSTFVVVDFFDYESQTTTVVSGVRPEYDFAATYKLSIDDFLMRYLATDVITIELNMASQGDFTMLARCAIPLANLLRTKPCIKLRNHPMLSTQTNQVVAFVTIEIRLALSISELYKLFLERHPNEKRHIEELAAKKLLEASSTLPMIAQASAAGGGDSEAHRQAAQLLSLTTVDDDNRLYNELEIVVHKCKGLSVNSAGKPPSPYVHFQFLGHPDKFTAPVFNSSDPEFNEKFTFPMVTTDNQLRLISRAKLTLSILDMEEEQNERALSMNGRADDVIGYIGDVLLPLDVLGDGVAISDTFLIKSHQTNRPVGEISVSLRWKFPLKRQRDLGPRALTAIDVETLIGAFAPNNIKEGLVDYNAFVRFITPPKQALLAIEVLSNYLRAQLDAQGKTPKEVLQMLFSTPNGPSPRGGADGIAAGRSSDVSSQRIRKEAFVEQLLKLHLHALLPVDLEKLFHYMDTAQEGSLSIEQIIGILNVDENATLTSALRMKLLERAADLLNRGIQPLQLFINADQWGSNGLVTRLEFKNVLKQMGFALVDEPDPIQETIVVGEGSNKSARRGKKSVSDPSGAEDQKLNDDRLAQDDLLELENEKNQEISSFMRKQRELFDQKKLELQQRSQQALDMESISGAGGTSTPRDSQTDRANQRNATIAMRDNMLKQSTVPSTPLPLFDDHRTAMERTQSNRGMMSSSPGTPDHLATKLQSQFRGYQTRRKLSTSPLGNSPVLQKYRQSPPDREQWHQRNVEKHQLVAQRRLGQSTTTANVQPMARQDTAAVSQSKTLISSGMSSIVSVERLLRKNLFNQPLPSLIEGFHKVDGKRIGVVTRQQFAHVMSMYPAVGLLGPAMRIAMDYFDKDGNNHIDYHAFLRFVSAAMSANGVVPSAIVTIDVSSVTNPSSAFGILVDPSAIIFALPSIIKLRSVAVTGTMFQTFAAADKQGSGLLPRAEILRCFADSGYSQFSQAVLLSICTLFETQQEGLVNYTNLLDVAKENPLSRDVHQLAQRLYTLVCYGEQSAVSRITRDAVPVTEKSLREWFARIDARQTGKVILSHFVHFCREFLSISTGDGASESQEENVVSKEAIAALYSEFDASNGGFQFKDWMQWFTTFKRLHAQLFMPQFATDNNAQESNSFAQLSLEEIRRKCGAFCNQLASSNALAMAQAASTQSMAFSNTASAPFAVALDSIRSIFALYDWRAHSDSVSTLSAANNNNNSSPDGFVDKTVFAHILVNRIGLPVSANELKLMASSFSLLENRNLVAYPKFLSWLQQSANPQANNNLSSTNKPPLDMKSANRSAAVIRLLEHSLTRGIDLLSLFGKFDKESVGRILPSEFCSVVTELGLSSLSEREARDCAERFDCMAGNTYILYRRMITDLLRRLDSQERAKDKQLVSDNRVGNNGKAPSNELVDIFCQAMRECNTDVPSLRMACERYDRRNRGLISQEDFVSALQSLRLRLRGSDLQHWIDRFHDANDSSMLMYNAMVKAIQYHQQQQQQQRGGQGKNGIADQDTSLEVADRDLQKWKAQLSDELIYKLKGHFEGLILQGINYRDEFDTFDSDCTGTVTALEFVSILRDRLRMKSITDQEMSLLQRLYMSRQVDSRRIDFVRFLLDFHPRNMIAGMPHPNEHNKMLEIADDLRRKIRRRCENRDFFAPDALRRPFRHFVAASSRGNREVSRDARVYQADFVSAIRSLGFQLLPEQENSLFEHICQFIAPGGQQSEDDDNRTQSSFDYQTFSVFVCDPNFKDLVWKLRRLIARKEVKERDLAVQLTRSDVHDTNRLTGKQFQSAMASLGIDLSDSDIFRFLLRFDSNASQRLDINSFLDFVRGKKSASNERVTEPSIRAGGGERETDRDSEPVDVRQRASEGDGTESGLRAWQLIRKKIEERLSLGFTHNEVFALFDAENRGNIDVLSMSRGLKSMGLSLARGDVRFVLKRLANIVDNGELSRDALFQAFDIPLPSSNSRSKKQAYGDDFADDGLSLSVARGGDADRDGGNGSGSSLIASIRRRIEDFLRVDSLVNSLPAQRRVKDAFIEVDRLQDHAIDGRTLSNVLSQFRVDLRNTDIDRLMTAVGTSHSQSSKTYALIDYRDLLDLLFFADGKDPSKDSNTREVTDKLLAMIVQKASSYLNTTDIYVVIRKLKDAFLDVDRSGLAQVDRNALSEGLFRVRIELLSSEIDRLFDRFDPQRRNVIRIREFIDALEMHSSAIAATSSGVTRSSLSGGSPLDNLLDSIRQQICRDVGLRPGEESVNNPRVTRRLKEVFMDVDRNGSGTLDRKEWRECIKQLRVEMRVADFDLLFDRFDRNHNDQLDYREFLDVFDSPTRRSLSTTTTAANSSTAGVGFTDNNDVELQQIVSSLRRQLQDEMHVDTLSQATRQLKEAFQDCDRNGNNRLEKREFREALARYHIALPSADIHRVFDAFDRNRDGTLDYNEFLRFLDVDNASQIRGGGGGGGTPSGVRRVGIPESTSPRTKSEIEDVVRSIQRDLDKYLSPTGGENKARRLKMVFQDIDRNGNSRLDRRELAEGLKRFRIDLRPKELDLVFQCLDRDRNECIDYREFLELLDSHGSAGAGAGVSVKWSPESKR